LIARRSAKEIDKLFAASQVVAETLAVIEENLKPGITTGELDRIAERHIRSLGAVPAFLGYNGFPASICASLNDEVVHGIPADSRAVAEGDVISVDVGAIVSGYYGDAAKTFAIGAVTPEAAKLLEVTEEALLKGIEKCFPGNRLSDIGAAVQAHAESFGFSVVRRYVGHGIGRKMHEDPPIPNYGIPGNGPHLRAGMVFAIEPMINIGGAEVATKEDEWTVVTTDGSLSAHFEHTIAIGKDGPRVLSA
jgi:methionyl aminopeptidase